MTNWDLLVENHFAARKQKPLTEILNQLIEQVMAEALDPGPTPVLGEENTSSPGDARRERMLRLPIQFPTEISVGQKPTSEDRASFETWMGRIPGRSLNEKVDAIESFLANPPTGTVAETLSFLMFLNSFAYILKEFNASVAGFLWEPFLAGLIGGKASRQVPTSEHDIADVKLEGERFSLKILRPDGDVGGSFTDLVDHFSENPDEPMTYYVIKKMPGEIMAFFEFSISQETFFNFIGHPKTEKAFAEETAPVPYSISEPTLVRNILKASVNQLGLDFPAGSKVVKITQLGEDEGLAGILEPGEYDLHVSKRITVAGRAGKGAKLSANARHLWGSQEQYEEWYGLRERPDFWQLVSGQGAHAPAPGYAGGKSKGKQFEIGWGYALSNKLVENIGNINISKKSLDTAFANGSAIIGADLTDMFNALTALVDNVGRFFLIDCGGATTRAVKCTEEDGARRTAAGQQAVADATRLKEVVDAKIAPAVQVTENKNT